MSMTEAEQRRLRRLEGLRIERRRLLLRLREVQKELAELASGRAGGEPDDNSRSEAQPATAPSGVVRSDLQGTSGERPERLPMSSGATPGDDDSEFPDRLRYAGASHPSLGRPADPENCPDCAGTGRNYHYPDTACDLCKGAGIKP